MAKYGFLTCPDCGQTVEKTSPNKKRCTPCALKAHGETRDGYSDRSCEMCSAAYKPTSQSQKVCADCTPAFRSFKNTTYFRAKRAARGAPAIGQMLNCYRCGEPTPYRSGPHKFCTACQDRQKYAQNQAWAAAHPERHRAISRRSRDNYYFGGNREKALERDNYACCRCGSLDDLHVHHIDRHGMTTPRELRNNDLGNLETLCRSCHTVEHFTREGRGRNHAAALAINSALAARRGS